jgi:ATP-dependent NAD(P)H-hydrate dehydratase
MRFPAKEVEQMTEEWATKLKGWEKAIHSWIIGPGLGRDPYMQEFLPLLIKNLPDNSLVVFDADGIYYLCHKPYLFDELARFRTILTPNYRELAILQKVYKIDVDEILRNADSREEIAEISCRQAFPHFKLLIKGPTDIILGKERSFVVRTEGGKKRCGGMGDILAGAVSVCALWDFEYGPALASRVVRLATKAAFEKEGRGLTAPSVIKELAQTVKNIESDIY